MKLIFSLLLAVAVLLACGVLAQEALSAQETNAASQSVDLKVLQWTDDKAPGGFMTGLQLVSLPPEQCRDIVAKAKPTQPPVVKPNFKTPLAAADYFGSHLNMVEPPKYMAVHTDANGSKCYLFSGGSHWGKRPFFSEVAALLETGEIRFMNTEANKASEAIEVRLSIRNDKSDDTVVNRENLTRIKQFILAHGKRETYCNMYNNNPAYETKRCHFYLWPDSGQANINCETNKSDFQTMVIRVSALSGKKNQYRRVEFGDPNVLQIIATSPSADLTVSEVKNVVVDALKEILTEIDDAKPNKAPEDTARKLAEPPQILPSEGVSENFPRAMQAVKLVQTGDFAKAKTILLQLTQRDFARKPRIELMSEEQAEVVDVPAIGNRDLLLARCYLELTEHDAAQALLWAQVEKECTTQDLFILLVREFQGKRLALAEKKLSEMRKYFPHNDTVVLAQQYLTVARTVPDGNVAAAVDLIRSGSWSRESERGPLAEFKEWACTRLANYPQATLQTLIGALETNEQPTWIIYCLGQSGSRRALAPLEKAKQRIKNYHARLEIDAAIAKIKNTQQERPW